MKSGDKIRILIDGWDCADVLVGDILTVEWANHEMVYTIDGWGFDIKGLEEGGFELLNLSDGNLPVNIVLTTPSLSVKFKKLSDNAVVPSYAKNGDAGLDFIATSKLEKDDQVVYGTGIAIEIPEGYVGLMFPRSSIYKKVLSLSNSVGVIDSGYRGEIKFVFNFRKTEIAEYLYSAYSYDVGDKIGQLVIMPYPKVTLEEVEELSDSERGTTGWGSSGR